MIHHTNGHRRARVAHPTPLVTHALSALLVGAGFKIVTGGDAGGPVDLAIVGDDFASAAARTIAVVEADDLAAQRAATARGVAGMIATTASVDHFRACIDAVASGGRWHDPEIVAGIDTGPTLTRRERDVAGLVAAGQRNRTIAAALGISEGTVKMHLHNVYAKLGLESRTQLAMNVRARG